MTMTKYINKQAVLNLIDDLEFDSKAATWDNPWGSGEIILKSDTLDKLHEAVKALPAADVAPVVHANWIEDDYAYARCSECGYEMEHPEEKTPYCPNCGAIMLATTQNGR